MVMSIHHRHCIRRLLHLLLKQGRQHHLPNLFDEGAKFLDWNNDGKLDLLVFHPYSGPHLFEFNGSTFSEKVQTAGGKPFFNAGPGGNYAALSYVDVNGMYVYDVNNDGRNDVITALAAHGYGLAWYENIKSDSGDNGGDITFKQHLILSPNPDEKLNGIEQFSQLHAVDLVDMDGDGVKDILTGKRYWAHGPHGDPDPEGTPVLYWFKLQRRLDAGPGVLYEPHLIDAHSGVGTQIVARDANGDGKADVIVGNKRGTILFLSK